MIATSFGGEDHDRRYEDDLPLRKKGIKILFLSLILFMICALTPNTRQAYRIYGVSATINYLKDNDDEYLYIDLDDFRYEKEDLYNIELFLQKNKIKICIIENYVEGFPIPKVDTLILSSIYYIQLENFDTLKVMPLDFEEYLLFDTKHQNTTNSFNSLLKYGNIPDIIEYKDYKKIIRNKELIQLYDKNSTVIYNYITNQINTKNIINKSTNNSYNPINRI